MMNPEIISALSSAFTGHEVVRLETSRLSFPCRLVEIGSGVKNLDDFFSLTFVLRTCHEPTLKKAWSVNEVAPPDGFYWFKTPEMDEPVVARIRRSSLDPDCAYVTFPGNELEYALDEDGIKNGTFIGPIELPGAFRS